MWDLSSRNRGIFVIISLLSVCAILYNAWGPILALTLSIILVIYVCYSLLTNDSILSPQTLDIFIKYIREAGKEINCYLNNGSFYLSTTIRKLIVILNKNYKNYVLSKMNRFRKNSYQLSNDNHDVTSRNSSRFDLTTNQLSPISKNDYQENITFDNQRRNNYSADKLTSTPLVPLRRDTNLHANGAIGLFTPNRPLRQDAQHSYHHNHASLRADETVFSPEGSPWGTSISPKIRSKASGIKTVQTIAGPLLASTRYNIDPKVYSDVTSPGLSTRLAKYATEANSKLIHQSQYGTGQFPRVNLNASSLPLISVKNTKIRSPVTVRIAPPEASRYSPPERQKLISDVCRAESRAAPSVVQVLREISLKRHASREDVSSDLIKKQRTEGLFDENFDNLEAAKQKRSREDSPNTEEEILAKNNQLRPVKKTKTPSCYDVLNSLSSSNQYSSGIKRKASTLDLSRSGTPDIEKHFKACETVGNVPKISPNVVEPQTEVKRPHKHDLSDKSSPRIENKSNTFREQTAVRVKGILKQQTGKDATADQQQNLSLEKQATPEEKRETEIEIEIEKKSSPAKNKQVNFNNKLFMKAEPQTNERLRTLIQEQGNIKAKFTSDDVDEIKKEDIVNMRQTSMRARLQSMFDAISGKSTKKINPDVIIHAEGTSEPNPAPATPASSATLSSTTSTTNINTSPIATSAVAPTVADSKLSTTTTKHVTFNLPSTQSSSDSQNSATKPISSAESKTNTTEAGNQNPEALKFSFGSVASTTTSSTPLSVPNSTFSSPNKQSTISVPSVVTPSKAPSSFITTSSTQNLAQPLANSNVNVTLATNSSLNFPAGTSTVSKGLLTSSSVTFTSSNLNNVNQNSSIGAPAIFGVATTSPSGLGSTNFTLESNKSVEAVKTSSQSFAPMPNFSFGASKTSSPVSVFGGNTQPTLISTRNQVITTNASVTTTAILSFVPSTFTQTQHSAFNTSSASSAPPTSNTAVTTSAQFAFGGTNTVPQSISSGSFPFTTNTNATKSQNPAFGNTSTQNPPPYGATATQNSPSFGNSINFQGVQASGNVNVATEQSTPTFGSNLTSNKNPPAFGSAATTAQSTPTFGTVASSAPPPTFGNTSTTSSSFAFGNTAAQTSTISAFATNTNSTPQSTTTAATANATFSFGSSTTQSTKPGFSFNANIPQTTTSTGGIQASTTSNPIPVFGAAAASNAAPVFGTPTTAPPAYGTPTTAPPAFGTSATTAPPAFGTPSTTAPPAFGAISTTATPVFGASSSTATPVFGAISTTAQPLFGTPATSTNQPNAFGTPKTTAPPSFESHTSDPNFSYAGANMPKNSPFAATSFVNTPNTSVSTAGNNTFGGNALMKSVFTGWGTQGFGNSSSSFSTTENSAPGGNTTGFGAQTSTTPAFGTQNSTVKQIPQGPPPAFGSTASTFGPTTTAPPAFGTNTVTSPGFGSSSPAFGAQVQTAPPSFGASTGNPPPAFGANVATPFGGQSQNAAPTFGTQNSTAPTFAPTNNNQNATFAFGANQTQTHQNSGFSFGGTASNTNNNSSATAALFQFGGTPAKTEGFNFNATTTTPNMNFGATASSSFGTPTQGSNMFSTPLPTAPAGGMFSIGAGSTAARSRTTRPRRQR